MPERDRFGGSEEHEGFRSRQSPDDGKATAAGRKRKRFTVDALFSDTRPQAAGVTDLTSAKEIRRDRIVPDPDQPRRSFDDERLAELANSIAREGVLQPIVVSYDAAQDIYVIVHGERRWRAAGIAGQETLPAIVRDVPADRRLIHQLMENVVRDDLNAVDRAAALRALRGQLGGAPWEQVAEAVGIRRSRLFQLLGTEKLPERAQDDIRAGRLSEKQSRALQGLPPARQDALHAAIVAHSLSAGQAERLARMLKTTPAPADESPAEAREAIAGVLALIDPAALSHQSTELLGALSAATVAPSRESAARLKALSALIGAPRFDQTRMDRQIHGLAASLAKATGETLRQPGTRRELLALRDAIDGLLGARGAPDRDA
jgi:ParB family chromosome partitioning protein